MSADMICVTLCIYWLNQEGEQFGGVQHETGMNDEEA
jgi:hypothetical protein